MRKAFLAIVMALCLVMLLGATTMAAPRVGLNSFAMDLGVAGINPHGDPAIWWMSLGGAGIGGFVDLSLALPGGFSLRAAYQRTWGDFYQLALGEAVLQYDPGPYGAFFAGGLLLGGYPGPWGGGNYTVICPQAGLLLRAPIGENLSLYGMLSAYYEVPTHQIIPGYGAYLTLDFGHGFGLTAGARGFGSELTKSPWITAGLSWTF